MFTLHNLILAVVFMFLGDCVRCRIESLLPKKPVRIKALTKRKTRTILKEDQRRKLR
jgi:hypothetical protein